MLHEYAVEPAAIAESWQSFRYLIEKFGFEQGRLIAQFPSSWKRLVYEATRNLSDGENKKRIEVRLQQLPNGVFLRSGRPYSPQLGWIDNAVSEHQRRPFRAIIARDDLPGGEGVVHSSDVGDEHPLMAVAPVSTAATNQSRWRRKSRPSQRIFLSEDRFFVRPARTASSSRPAVSTAVARGGGQGGPKGTA